MTESNETNKMPQAGVPQTAAQQQSHLHEPPKPPLYGTSQVTPAPVSAASTAPAQSTPAAQTAPVQPTSAASTAPAQSTQSLPVAQPTQQEHATQQGHTAQHSQPTQTAQMPPVYGQDAQQASNYNFTQPVSVTSAKPAKKEKKSGGARTFLTAFLGALLACALAFGGFTIYNNNTKSSSSSSSSSQTQLGSQSSSSTSGSQDEDLTLAESVAQKCLPSVAAIDVYSSQSSNSYGFSYGYGSQDSSGTLTQTSLGSGVVLTADGYVVTNYHVISEGQAYKVTIEGETYDAELVRSDSSSDIAVLKAKDASGLTAVEIGDSDSLTIGEWVMTIGSPFGLEQSVATGIVSATSRSQIVNSSSSDSYGYSSSSGQATIYPNMIQTDAAINPGNSGGALVDQNGKLIGLNTLITSYSGNYSGVGFAIPVNYAVNIAQQIIDGKTPTHAQLGVTLSTVNEQAAKRYGLAVSSGAYISSVATGGGAEAAGIQQGDIVTAFDGQEVTSASDLMLDIRAKNPGDKVTVTINRNGESKDVEVTLGSDESSQQSSTQQENSQQGQNSGSSSGSGSMLEKLFGN